jgi:hypothetical protein
MAISRVWALLHFAHVHLAQMDGVVKRPGSLALASLVSLSPFAACLPT